MIAGIADRVGNDAKRIDSIAETGMATGSDGLTRLAQICVACGSKHGAHAVRATDVDRSVGYCDLCGTYSYMLYPVSCWGGLVSASGVCDNAAEDGETHYGMADAARTATAGQRTQQAARSCDQSAKPGTDKETAKTVARYQRDCSERCLDLSERLQALRMMQAGNCRASGDIDCVCRILRAISEDILIAATRNDFS